jgi:acyl-CoA thioesterase-1
MIKKIALISIPAILILFFVCRSPSINYWDIKKGEKPSKLIFLGDSLTAGFGLSDINNSFPSLVAKSLNLPMVRHGYNGHTTESILPKLSDLKNEKPTLLILTIGGNDILKKVNLEETEKNLRTIFSKLQAMGHTVVFTEVLSFFDGKRHKMHIKLCKEFSITLIPDILSGLINDSDKMTDLIHPAKAGCEVISKRIVKTLKETELVN